MLQKNINLINHHILHQVEICPKYIILGWVFPNLSKKL